MQQLAKLGTAIVMLMVLNSFAYADDVDKTTKLKICDPSSGDCIETDSLLNFEQIKTLSPYLSDPNAMKLFQSIDYVRCVTRCEQEEAPETIEACKEKCNSEWQ